MVAECDDPDAQNDPPTFTQLVQFIERVKRAPIDTNFDDPMGDETKVELAAFSGPDTLERFRSKAQAF